VEVVDVVVAPVVEVVGVAHVVAARRSPSPPP
jgi:hypothetical protein